LVHVVEDPQNPDKKDVALVALALPVTLALEYPDLELLKLNPGMLM